MTSLFQCLGTTVDVRSVKTVYLMRTVMSSAPCTRSINAGWLPIRLLLHDAMAGNIMFSGFLSLCMNIDGVRRSVGKQNRIRDKLA